MRVSVRDLGHLVSTRPADLQGYLRARGWQHVEAPQGRVSCWTICDAEGGEYEVAVPLEPEYADYPSRVADALATLELVEDRSQLAILADIGTTSFDVLRLSSKKADSTSGNIPLEAGAQFITYAKEMVLAAASAAVEPRAYWPTRKPTQAVEYLHRVRLGQTEHGSYVVRILSPVPPALKREQMTLPGVPDEEPFERLAMRRLLEALHAMKQAAEAASASGSFAAFEQAVSKGVSANLCTAVGGIGEEAALGSVDAAVSWAPVRPLRSAVPTRARLSADLVPVVHEAGRLLREVSPWTDFEVRGAVVKLERESVTDVGQVTIQALVEGRLAKVGIRLPADDYASAIRAHRSGRSVACSGELQKQGRRFVLANQRDFRIAPPTPEDDDDDADGAASG